MPSSAIVTLLDLRAAEERAAARALAVAAQAREAAERRQEELAERAARARTDLGARRTAAPRGPVRIADAQAHDRFRARLAAELAAREAAVVAHRRDVLDPARRAEQAAGAAHLAARRRHAVVERALARRRAAERREADRRAEAAADDNRPRMRPPLS